MKKHSPTFIVYSNIEEIFVTTLELEPRLVEKMTEEWGYNLDPDDGDFERTEYGDGDGGIRIKHSTSLSVN